MRHKNTVAPTSSENQHIDTLIGKHAHFHGELDFEGALRIDGKFEGNIRSTDDGTLILSESAQITGEVDVPNLLLHGTVHGNVRASKSLKIGPTGKLNGDVEYSLVTLAEGAAVNGRCHRIEDKERVKKTAKANAVAGSVDHSPQTA